MTTKDIQYVIWSDGKTVRTSDIKEVAEIFKKNNEIYNQHKREESKW